MPSERFGLLINDRIVRTPVAIGIHGGVVDAAYVLERADHIGAAFIGGYSIDKPTMDAARAISDEAIAKNFCMMTRSENSEGRWLCWKRAV